MILDAAKYIPAIGLEVHVQLATDTKLFCGCPNKYDAESNSLTCPVCLGLPGALPVLNEKAVNYALKFIGAIGGQINSRSRFARKNYFYPDLPKGYQITQFDQPIGWGGKVSFIHKGEIREVNIIRAHIEEDAGKLIHPSDDPGKSYVDLNRCGVPLIEIVTEPMISSPEEANSFLKAVRQLVEYLDISEADLEKGQFRCDANLSIRPADTDIIGVKTELKNINSFRFVEKALQKEIERQIDIIERGDEVKSCTLLWDEKKQDVEIMRMKEEADDYRYFPEPDLPPLILKQADIEKVVENMIELPLEKQNRLISQYSLPFDLAEILIRNRHLADFFEDTISQFNEPQLVANWIINELLQYIDVESFGRENLKIRSEDIAEILSFIKLGRISVSTAKSVFAKMFETGRTADEIVSEKGLEQLNDPIVIRKIIVDVLENNRDNLNDYHSGKEKLFGYFVGEIINESGGKANPDLVNKILREILDEYKG